MHKIRTRLTVLALLLVLVAGFALIPAVSAQDAMAHVTCDADLILSLYTAEYSFDFAKVHDQMMVAHPDMKMSDLTVFDQGQFAPLFTAMMGMMDQNMSTGMMDDATTKSVMDAMVMSPADLDNAMNMMSSTDSSGGAMMTELTPGMLKDEPAECTALRDELRQFYTSLAYSSMLMADTQK